MRTPKHVFIFENGKYSEISYEQYTQRQKIYENYKNKKFIALHGMLMEVSQEDYIAYYKDKRRQKYLEE